MRPDLHTDANLRWESAGEGASVIPPDGAAATATDTTAAAPTLLSSSTPSTGIAEDLRTGSACMVQAGPDPVLSWVWGALLLDGRLVAAVTPAGGRYRATLYRADLVVSDRQTFDSREAAKRCAESHGRRAI